MKKTGCKGQRVKNGATCGVQEKQKEHPTYLEIFGGSFRKPKGFNIRRFLKQHL